MKIAEMMQELSTLGWEEYYNNHCYRSEWVGVKPYDRMAQPITTIYHNELEKGNIKRCCKNCFNSSEYNGEYECTVSCEVVRISDGVNHICDNWESIELDI